MSFQPPILWNMVAGNGYALQLQPGGVSTVIAQLRSGECYVQPIYARPTTQFATTDSTDNVAAGTRTLTPASMANIQVGSVLLVDAGAQQEYVLVTAVTGATFTASFAKAHNGTSTPFAIQGYAPPTAPAASPAPGAGAPAYGWWHMASAGEKRSQGVEPLPAAGTPIFPGAAADRIYGLLIWCQAAGSGELEINGH